MGADGVHPSVLRYCAEALAPALVHIFKLSIAEGRVPDKWKLGNITRILKKSKQIMSSELQASFVNFNFVQGYGRIGQRGHDAVPAFE